MSDTQQPNTIRRAVKNKENPYVIIRKASIADARLSLKAKGLLSYLLTLPDDWDIHIPELIKHTSDGKDSIYSGIKELEKYGYLSRSRERNPDGTLGKTITLLHEEPINLNDKQPHRDFPDVVKPDMDNPPLLYNDLLNTDLLHINKTNIVEFGKKQTSKKEIKQRKVSKPFKGKQNNYYRDVLIPEEAEEQILEVFQHWKKVHNHPRVCLDFDTKQRIYFALSGFPNSPYQGNSYSVDDLKAGVDGLGNSGWHMGQNDSGTLYDQIKHVLKTRQDLDKFIKLSTIIPNVKKSWAERQQEAGDARKELSEEILMAWNKAHGVV